MYLKNKKACFSKFILKDFLSLCVFYNFENSLLEEIFPDSDSNLNNIKEVSTKIETRLQSKAEVNKTFRRKCKVCTFLFLQEKQSFKFQQYIC